MTPRRQDRSSVLPGGRASWALPTHESPLLTQRIPIDLQRAAAAGCC